MVHKLTPKQGYVGLRSAYRQKILRYIISFHYWWYFSTVENAGQHFQSDVLSSSFSLRLGTMSVYPNGEITLVRTIQHSMNRLKKVQSSKNWNSNLLWNALYHIRNDLIKLSTNQAKKSGKNSTEKSDFKCVEIFKREELGFVFCLVLIILCVH